MWLVNQVSHIWWIMLTDFKNEFQDIKRRVVYEKLDLLSPTKNVFQSALFWIRNVIPSFNVVLVIIPANIELCIQSWNNRSWNNFLKFTDLNQDVNACSLSLSLSLTQTHTVVSVAPSDLQGPIGPLPQGVRCTANHGDIKSFIAPTSRHCSDELALWLPR